MRNDVTVLLLVMSYICYNVAWQAVCYISGAVPTGNSVQDHYSLKVTMASIREVTNDTVPVLIAGENSTAVNYGTPDLTTMDAVEILSDKRNERETENRKPSDQI
jgi:hypothetical protein